MPGARTERQSPLDDARLAILADYLQRRASRPGNQTWKERQAQVGLKAVALASTLDVCRALLAGDRVAWPVLDDVNARWLGVRPGCRRRDGHLALDDFADTPR